MLIIILIIFLYFLLFFKIIILFIYFYLFIVVQKNVKNCLFAIGIKNSFTTHWFAITNTSLTIDSYDEKSNSKK